jgi:hypothetical protein
MNEEVESGSTLGEPGESISETHLARGNDLNSPSPEELRQPTSQERSPSAPGAARQPAASLEEQIEAALGRRLQGIKDQRLSRLEDELVFLKKLVVAQGAAGTPAAAAVTAQPPERPAARASHVIQPSGGGLPPAPDLRTEYETRLASVRPGDVAGLMEIKREFRKKGLEVY